MKRLKFVIILVFLLLLSGCFSVSQTSSGAPSNSKIFSQFKDVELKDIDINKDNVIDKKELQLYQNKKSIDSLTPIYIISLICGSTIFVCFMPKLFSFVKNKIKK